MGIALTSYKYRPSRYGLIRVYRVMVAHWHSTLASIFDRAVHEYTIRKPAKSPDRAGRRWRSSKCRRVRVIRQGLETNRHQERSKSEQLHRATNPYNS